VLRSNALQHRPERAARAVGDCCRLHRGSRAGRADRHEHHRALAAPAPRSPARRPGGRPRSHSAAGQGAFTLTLLILFNILEPAGWRIGLCFVSRTSRWAAPSASSSVCLFWPRGAGAALGTALAEAYARLRALPRGRSGFRDGTLRRVRAVPAGPGRRSDAAAAAARRLDDAFRGYLAERGAKPVPLAEVTSLVNGVAGLPPRRRRRVGSLATR